MPLSRYLPAPWVMRIGCGSFFESMTSTATERCPRTSSCLVRLYREGGGREAGESERGGTSCRKWTCVSHICCSQFFPQVRICVSLCICSSIGLSALYLSSFSHLFALCFSLHSRESDRARSIGTSWGSAFPTHRLSRAPTYLQCDGLNHANMYGRRWDKSFVNRSMIRKNQKFW